MAGWLVADNKMKCMCPRERPTVGISSGGNSSKTNGELIVDYMNTKKLYDVTNRFFSFSLFRINLIAKLQ